LAAQSTAGATSSSRHAGNKHHVENKIGNPPLNREEERKLLEEYFTLREKLKALEKDTNASRADIEGIRKNWKRARDAIILANVGLVRREANKYGNADDLFMAGISGLLFGLDRFELKKEFRFGTYAMWWVKQSIQEAIARESSNFVTSVNTNVLHIMNVIRNFMSEYSDKHGEGKKPSFQEISDAVGIDRTKIKRVLSILNTTSLSNTFGESEEMLCDTITEHGTRNIGKADDNSTIDMVFNNDKRNAIEIAIQKYLNEDEGHILRSRYLVDKPLSLEATGKTLKLTKERIRQIEAQAIKKLKRLGSELLSDFIS
jgi:RNA polymerase primary sigma factor